MTDFEVVLRGYDRFTVDVLVQAVEAAEGDQRQIDAAIKEVTPLPPCGVPASLGENPFPASIIPAFNQSATIHLAGKSPITSSK